MEIQHWKFNRAHTSVCSTNEKETWKVKEKTWVWKKIPETKHVLKENSMWRACGLFADFSRSYASPFYNEKEKKRLGRSQCIYKVKIEY